MAISEEWLRFLREQFPEGSRIRLRSHGDDALEPGSMGILERITDDGGFHVAWEDGSHTELELGTDRFSVLPPELQTLKLYMPLTAEVYGRKENGDLEDDLTDLDSSQLTGYKDIIAATFRDNCEPEEKERGIMHWYDEDTPIDIKVRSAFFGVEERDGRLWCVAECRVAGSLSWEDMANLKQYLTGHASGGWGESLSQRDIQLDSGEMYVYLWNSENWSIQTEEECFGARIAEGLPELCYAVHEYTGELIVIKRGETGYHKTDYSTPDKERNVELADQLNKKLGVDMWQRQAMEVGSLCGWDVPGADPAKYLESYNPQMGGLS